jgi:hypothetical protein
VNLKAKKSKNKSIDYENEKRIFEKELNRAVMVKIF